MSTAACSTFLHCKLTSDAGGLIVHVHRRSLQHGSQHVWQTMYCVFMGPLLGEARAFLCLCASFLGAPNHIAGGQLGGVLISRCLVSCGQTTAGWASTAQWHLHAVVLLISHPQPTTTAVLPLCCLFLASILTSSSLSPTGWIDKSVMDLPRNK